jgi:hypothetical protein
MAKNRRQHRDYPSTGAYTPRPIVRPRVKIDRSLAWFAIWTAARAEERAAEVLIQAGFSTYVPTQSFEVVRRGKLIEVHRNPVSRYLFVGLNAVAPDVGAVDGALAPIGWGEPVLGSLIKVEREPIRVGAGALQAYADACAHNAVQSLASGRFGFAVGGKARIVSGGLSGLVMQVSDLVCDDRVRGLVDMLGGRVVVEATADQLEAA